LANLKFVAAKKPALILRFMFMRAAKQFALIFFVITLVSNAEASSAKIKKVLPHLIDSQGRNSLSPSLYERDAYQFFLRTHPEQRAGISFDVQWSAPKSANLTLLIEMRGASGDAIRTEKLEMPVKKKGLFSSWSSVVLRGEAYKNFGELVAWRATLWDGNKQIAEQKSFLW
jgi:hypothetical protein